MGESKQGIPLQAKPLSINILPLERSIAMSVTNIKHFKTAKLTKNKKRSCPSGKTRYKDHKQAVIVLHKMSNRRTNDIRDFGSTTYNQIRAYECNMCSGYHHSSNKKWDSRREAA